MIETRVETELRRRTVCVRACEGIPTDLLEDGFIARLFAACLHLEDPRVRDILAELVEAVKPRKRPSPSEPGHRFSAEVPRSGLAGPPPDSAVQGSLPALESAQP